MLKLLAGIVLGLVVLVLLAVGVAYAAGSRLPLDHVASVTGVVPAPPARVFALITNVAAAPRWRPAVQSVQLLPPRDGHEHWVEDLGHGQTMDFVAIRTDPVGPYGANAGPETIVARREVLLNDPHAQFGGTWTYELSPTRTGMGDEATQLKITETGFIKPPIYRFMMAHLFGMTKNLDVYMANLQAAMKR